MTTQTSETARLNTALSGRYLVEREIGAGGMATVYLAKDLKHDRDVAIKVLHTDLSAVLGAERFLAEVRITAKLDHPHILTLIDSGEADGIVYYIMPFVRGESLRKRIDREKQLPIDDALTITRQVASALDHAHARGIVHRDIKPENILIHEGVAVLADFGIALAVKEASGDRLTQTGLSLGTPRYMSPEQATGDRIVDARSDVYSLAAVLYEMIGGETPVTGATAQAIIARLLTEKPLSLRTVRDTVTPALDAALQRGLAKVPADRFSSAGDLARAADVAVAPGATTVNVVPRSRIWTRVAAGVVIVAALAAGGMFAAAKMRDTSMPFAGAVIVPITRSGHARSALPSPDGKQFVHVEESCDGGLCQAALVIRETDGAGFATIASTPGKENEPVGWSPDGRWLLLVAFDRKSQQIDGVDIVSQRGGTTRRITTSFYATFAANDTLLVVSGRAAPFWLRRQVLSTGLVVDSVLLPVKRSPQAIVQASPSGRRLFLVAPTQGDRVTFLYILDRNAKVTDSTAVANWQLRWDASSPEALLMVVAGAEGNATPGSTTRLLVRRRIDNNGRLLPPEALATFDQSSAFNALSADGKTLYFTRTERGEPSLWTAARDNATAPLASGRMLAQSKGLEAGGNNSFRYFLSPRGGWIARLEQRGEGRDRTSIVEVQQFAGGERRIVDTTDAPFYEIAFSWADDSVAIVTRKASDQFEVTTYPLRGGVPVIRGMFPGPVVDLEWLFDGRLSTPDDSGKRVQVFTAGKAAKSFPFPDSLGAIFNTARSPMRVAELAILSYKNVSASPSLWVSRMDMNTGHVTPIKEVTTFDLPGTRVFWTSGNDVCFALLDPVARSAGLVCVSVATGELRREAPPSFTLNAELDFISHDNRRALVRSRSQTTDIEVMRMPKGKR